MTTTPAVSDIRRLDDPPGVDNPYWQVVRRLPNSGLSFTGAWEPDGFGFDRADLYPAVVRAWAQDNGIQVNEKGRIPAGLVSQWREAAAGAGEATA